MILGCMGEVHTKVMEKKGKGQEEGETQRKRGSPRHVPPLREEIFPDIIGKVRQEGPQQD
jgi:hypothetical protein